MSGDRLTRAGIQARTKIKNRISHEKRKRAFRPAFRFEFVSLLQKVYLNPNCITRGDPWMESSFPKAGPGSLVGT